MDTDVVAVPFLPAVSHPPATTSKWVRRAPRALRNAGARHGASYIGVATLGALSKRLRGQIPATREADRGGPVDKRTPKLGALLVNRAKTTPSVKRPPAKTWLVDSDNAILRQHHAACHTSHRLRGKVNPCSKLQALDYDILPSTTAVFTYVIGSRKLSANEQFFVGAQTVVRLLQTTQIISDVCFITYHVAYASSNKTKII